MPNTTQNLSKKTIIPTIGKLAMNSDDIIPKNENPLNNDSNEIEKIEETTKLSQPNSNTAIYVKSQSSPIPSAEDLRAYDSVYPGLGKNLIDNFLKETEHRRKLELDLFEHQKNLEIENQKLDRLALIQQGELLKNNSKRSSHGLIAGTIISLVALVTAGTVTIKGYPVVGGLIGGSTVIGLATVFVIGQQPNQFKKEEESKEEKE